jgi:hypothetical protein
MTTKTPHLEPRDERRISATKPVLETTTAHHAPAEDVETLARWMDTAFRIPGLNLRFGWDSILGLFPGFGDVATSLASIYILQSAQRQGVSRVTLARMTLNVLVDVLLGSIPFVGDAFDLFWKSNHRNVDLMRRHLAMTPVQERRARKGDGLYVAVMIALILGLTLASVTAGFFVVKWLASMLNQALN